LPDCRHNCDKVIGAERAKIVFYSTSVRTHTTLNTDIQSVGASTEESSNTTLRLMSCRLCLKWIWCFVWRFLPSC